MESSDTASVLPRLRDSRGRVVSRWISGPIFDSVFLIAAPVLAAILALAIATGLLQWPNSGAGAIADNEAFWALLVFAVFTQGHLIVAVFRTHFNRRVFAEFPLRFTVVPLAVFLLAGFSSWALLVLLVVNVWWDVYHSSMQTFGLCRIYDRRAGNDPAELRRLDLWLNLTIYLGPILAGASLMLHVNQFRQFGRVGSLFLAETVPVFVQSWAGALSRIVVAVSALFVLYYLVSYYRHHRAGYHVSLQKVALLAGTALTSLWAWTFNPFGMAFLIANLFHGLQYYALVYCQEKSNIADVFRLGSGRKGKVLALLSIVLVGASYGTAAGLSGRSLAGVSHWAWSSFLTVAVMHFWYDGFVWSVRARTPAVAVAV